MFSHHRMSVFLIIFVGLVLKFGSPLIWLLELSKPTETWAFFVPYLLGTGIYVWGCCEWAMAKNRPGVWGLTGFFCVCALPFLYCLEDRSVGRSGAN